MKINAVLIPRRPLKRKGPIAESDRNLYITVLILALAVLCGVMLYISARSNIDARLTDMFLDHIQSFKNKSNPEVISGLLLQVFPYFILMLIFSTSIVGEVFVYTVSFIKIMSLSVCVTYLYSTYKLSGIEYCFLIFLPGKFIMILSILLLISCCATIIKSIREKTYEYKSGLKTVLVKIAVISLLLIAATGVEFMTTSFFSHMFDFESFL